jgi:hypothetical protein
MGWIEIIDNFFFMTDSLVIHFKWFIMSKKKNFYPKKLFFKISSRMLMFPEIILQEVIITQAKPILPQSIFYRAVLFCLEMN